MLREEWVNICMAAGLTKGEAEYGYDTMPEDDYLPSTPECREAINEVIKQYMPKFIEARKRKK